MEAASEAPAAPDGWTSVWSKSNQRWYFFNTTTGVSTYDRPAGAGAAAAAAAPATTAASAQPAAAARPSSDGLPRGWTVEWSKSNNKWYFFSSSTGVSQFDRPASLTGADLAAAAATASPLGTSPAPPGASPALSSASSARSAGGAGHKRKRSGADAEREKAPERPEKLDDGKLFFLFPKATPKQRGELRLDETAVWSVTDGRSADRISKLALGLDGITAESVLFDGCACVGGNVASFSKHFAKVRRCGDRTRKEEEENTHPR